MPSEPDCGADAVGPLVLIQPRPSRLESEKRGNFNGLLEINAHESGIETVAFSPDGTSIATGGIDGVARILSAKDGREVRAFHHRLDVTSIAFDPSGTTVAVAHSDGLLAFYDVRSGVRQGAQNLESYILAICPNPKDGAFAAALGNHTVRLLRPPRRPN
jgi:WD40 repeat protein